MRRFDARTTSLADLRRAFDARLSGASDSAEAGVRAILDDVRTRGDAALLDYTQRWDCPTASAVRVPAVDIAAAAERVRATDLWPAMELAAQRIRTFHERQLRTSWTDVGQGNAGEILGQIVRPLARVGVYVPGGTADYPSTVLMAALPARVAGVPSIALATPPRRDTGLPPDATLAAAYLAGIDEVYAVGGAQAVAAFAYGTESVVRVDKVVGPGNLYVNLAKRLVYGTCGIDMLAGPSEVAVLADEFADPQAAAAEILTQCEHDTHSSALIASPSGAFLEAIEAAIESQLPTLPRAEIVRAALSGQGYAVLTRTLEEAAQVVSLYAPEHLHLLVREPWGLLGRLENAGAIFVGEHSSAPLGDYVAGPSHTLPTAGCARFASPLNVDDFVKKTSLVYLDDAAARKIAPAAATFARFEGLTAHERAANRHTQTSTDGVS